MADKSGFSLRGEVDPEQQRLNRTSNSYKQYTYTQ